MQMKFSLALLFKICLNKFIDFRGRGRVGRERGRERNIDRLPPDQGSNPQPFGLWDDALTN